jgi:pantothenate kinase-related protein Tda10
MSDEQLQSFENNLLNYLKLYLDSFRMTNCVFALETIDARFARAKNINQGN